MVFRTKSAPSRFRRERSNGRASRANAPETPSAITTGASHPGRPVPLAGNNHDVYPVVTSTPTARTAARRRSAGVARRGGGRYPTSRRSRAQGRRVVHVDRVAGAEHDCEDDQPGSP